MRRESASNERKERKRERKSEDKREDKNALRRREGTLQLRKDQLRPTSPMLREHLPLVMLPRDPLREHRGEIGVSKIKLERIGICRERL